MEKIDNKYDTTQPLSYKETVSAPMHIVLKKFIVLALIVWIAMPIALRYFFIPESVSLAKIPTLAWHFLLHPPPAYFLLPIFTVLWIGLFLANRSKITIKNGILVLPHEYRSPPRRIPLEDIISCDILKFDYSGWKYFFGNPPGIDNSQIVTLPGFKGSGLIISYSGAKMDLKNVISMSLTSKSKPDKELIKVHFPTNNPQGLNAIILGVLGDKK